MPKASAKLVWRRYRRKVRNAKGAGRFLLGGRVMFSGYAPNTQFNRELCRAYNRRLIREPR